MPEKSWLDSRQRHFVLPFKPSRPALESTQPPVRWVSVGSSVQEERPERKAEFSPPTDTDGNKEWRYNFMACTGTTLPLLYCTSVPHKCLLKHIIEGQREKQMAGRRGRIHRQLLDDLKIKAGYRKLNGEALDRTLENSLLEEAID